MGCERFNDVVQFAKATMTCMNRRQFVTLTLSGCTWLVHEPALFAAASVSPTSQSLIPRREDGWPPEILLPPKDPKLWPPWREALAAFRHEARQKLNYDDSLYRRPDFAWVSSCFTCCFLMLNDERFLDARRGRYRVEKFLDAEERKFGGYDAVVLWQAYPRIGLDDRTQFDFYREMPGGLAGLRGVCRRFHRRGLKVFLCYNPWDKGTRVGGENHLESLTRMVGALEADGIFLDTMDKAGSEFRERLDGVRKGVALEGEIALPMASVHDHHLSWMQWWNEYDSPAPGVLRNKWFERRHMQHEIRRWSWDHTAELHTAWMNGSGMMVWENVFGQWVGWSERDQSILRAMLPIQRAFAGLFSGEDWTPLVPTEKSDVFASQWGSGDRRLWTLVNRTDEVREGALLTVESRPGMQFFDLITGRKAAGGIRESRRILEGRIAPRSIGCFLGANDATRPEQLESLLKRQRTTLTRHSNKNTFFKSEAIRVQVLPTALRRGIPAGMVPLPAAKLELTSEFQVREVGFYSAWTDRPISGGWLSEKTTVTRKANLTAYAVDEIPITNAQFAEFLKDSGYRPRVADNFLKHWSNGRPPTGREDHPVVYVTLDDARAYAAWARKRLPTENEWQYAAQGPEALTYPWGAEDDPGCRNGGQKGGTTPVRAFPKGRSPFGAWDLCGNVWELTESEHSDGRNRFVMLKGGSYYRAEGSMWYFDGGARPNRHTAKMLLFWPGLDRCATVGFRCVVDLQSPSE